MSNIIKFFISTVTSYTEDDVDIIAFGDDDEMPQNYVIISRFDDPGADDSPRDEMIGIQTSQSAYEVSAAILSIKLSRNSIEIVIRDELADKVGANILVADFSINDNSFENLRKYVERIILGSNINFMKGY